MAVAFASWAWRAFGVLAALAGIAYVARTSMPARASVREAIRFKGDPSFHRSTDPPSLADGSTHRPRGRRPDRDPARAAAAGREIEAWAPLLSCGEAGENARMLAPGVDSRNFAKQDEMDLRRASDTTDDRRSINFPDPKEVVPMRTRLLLPLSIAALAGAVWITGTGAASGAGGPQTATLAAAALTTVG